MAFRSISGGKIVGSGTPQPVPITLDPAPYLGSLVNGQDGRLYVSNGSAWVDVGSGVQGTTGIQGFDGIQGVQGTYGPGFTIIGSVPDANAGGDPQTTLSTAFPGATVGDGVIDDTLDELWIYDGTNWVNIGSFRGVQGFQGIQGIQGMQGTIGEEGIQGSRGFRGNQGVQGLQGTTGIQGNQGIQGLQGTQGVQGMQGTTGIQGDLGFQGTQGTQGPQSTQGTTGIQGDTGIQGTTGSYGGISFEYAFSVDTSATDPGNSNIKFNNSTQPATTEVYINENANPGARDISALLNAIDISTNPIKGYAKLTKVSNTADFALFQINDITDNTGWFTINVTTLSVAGTFADLDDVVISFVESGAQGVQGVQGIQGTTGIQGTQGLLGFQGTQGPQSTQGIQGTTGIQGLQGVQGLTGYQGVQGTTGAQGTQGAQGVQGGGGFQGAQGTTGAQGFQGAQGFTGYNGGLSYLWDFNASTTEGFPGLNSWLLNNADVTQATKLYIDDLTDSGRRVDELFNYLDSFTSNPKGQIFIRTPKNPATGNYQFLIFEYTDWVWGVTGTGSDWGHFTVNLIERSELDGTDLSPGTDWDFVTTTYGNTAVFEFIPAGQRGAQGIQGTVGLQGDLGVQGVQGIQGPQSIQGIQGFIGVQGEAGSYGGSSFEYDFSPDVTPTGPAAGLFKFNNANIQSATILRLSETETYGNDIGAFLATLDDNTSTIKAYIKLTSVANPAEFAMYGMTALTDAGSYVNMSVTHLASSANMDATYLTNNTDTVISFTSSGDAGVQGPQGVQGLQGLQGDLGIQGATGAGTQGAQGVQGDLGFQGTQGFPGPIGPQGIQGASGFQGTGGLQGATGGFGGVTFDYTFSTNTAATDPGVGILKFNNTSLSSATIMYIDDRDDNFNDIQTFLRTVDDSTSPIKGHFKVSEKLDPSKFVLYTVTSITEQTGYFEIAGGYVSGSVTTFADAEDVIITFARTGDIGPAGPQGPQGTQAAQGIQGVAGGIGVQGVQGIQGELGTQGSQGTAGFIGGSGIQGFQGMQGLQGVQGIAGVDGTSGFQGVQGLQGNDGTGAQGIQGTDGSQGTAGVGATGIQGFQGIQGVANQGIQGVQGNDGPPGFGNQGFQGFQGSQGTIGQIGIQGVQGIGGQGTSGLQGVQGIQGTVAAQGIQGITGDGNQGVQGFQGASGIGNTGIQGNTGFQGIQGLIGESGVGGFQGVQGNNGIQGFQGIDGGLGNDGPQGAQGTQGDYGFQGPPGVGFQGIQGSQGTQGPLGIQGFPGQGTQGIQGIQAAQGVQGERGFQGTQGVQGPGIQGGIPNIQNVHETALQGTPLFIGFIEAGSSHRPLMATTGPNPGGESNFFYTNDIDTLTVENLDVIGNLTVSGTADVGTITGVSSDFHVPTDVDVLFGGTRSVPYVKLGFESLSTSIIMDANTSIVSAITFRELSSGTSQFNFNMQTGEFTAAGDISANSDERLKENIETIDNALDKVVNMRGVYFDMKANPGVRKTGLIAQEVEAVLPEVVTTKEDGEGIKSVAYGNIVGLLVEAIKDLNKKVDDLKDQ